MRLSDKKLSRLNSEINGSDDYWYITKQECDFRNLCYIADILSRWSESSGQNYEDFFDQTKKTEPYKNFIGSTAHRATKNLTPFGLRNGAIGYKPSDLTPVFYKIKDITSGNYADRNLYQHIIDQQVEKIQITTAHLSLYPMMFTFKVLLTLGDVTGSYSISIEEFKTFVATAAKWDEYLETVDAILRFRNDPEYKKAVSESNGKSTANDSRYNLVIANHSLISTEGNNISLIPKKINEVRLKVVKYEIGEQSGIEDVEVTEPHSASATQSETLQQIFFGAPGVGKSYNLKSVYKNEKDVVRITFHPETDYASFVGCYKPIKSNPIKYEILNAEELISQAKSISSVADRVNFIFKYAESLTHAVEEKHLKSVNRLIADHFGWDSDTYYKSVLISISTERNELNPGEISYEFCPQAFTKAYVRAWKNPDAPVFLIIEEINRGNCAQIFGDIFQLLDRESDGFSSYKISSDHDLQQYLKREFNNTDIADSDIKDGTKMQLPPNLHILATMNTSDQSLFPIDSAFRRRWDWVYMPVESNPIGVNDRPIKRYIQTENSLYDWSDFIIAINKRIFNTTLSEDKQLGFWFIKPKGTDSIIKAEDFVSKVIFFLWNDVYKDLTDDATSIFNFAEDGNPDSQNKTHHTFRDFTPAFRKVNHEMIDAFILNIGIKPQTPPKEETTDLISDPSKDTTE